MLWTDPFAPLLTLFTRQAGFLAVGDLSVSDRELVLALDLPGLTAGDVSIEVQGTQLTVSGERKRPEAEEGASYVYAQRPFGGFEYRVQIPEGVDPDSIGASMHNGVLTLIVPKPEPLQPKRISIGARQQEELEVTEEDRRLEPAGV